MSGAADALATVPGLQELAAAQAMIVSRDQLRDLGVTAHDIAHQVAAQRWQVLGREVVALHTGPVVGTSRLWAALLSCGPTSALASWTALELWGLQGWQRSAVHVVVPRGARPDVLPGVVLHESRRHRSDDVVVHRGLRAHPCARAAVDAAAWSRSPRTAVGLLAAVVQQRRATVAELHEALLTAGRVRYHLLRRRSLDDLAGGSQSLAEIDLVRLCRRGGLPEPRRQSRRRDSRGRWRYLDAEWDLSGGRRLLLEIDGIGHMEQERWYDDLLRTAELPVPDARALLRLPAAAARTDPDRVLAILRRHLIAP
ncbi:hypothetical protein J4G33_14800 [Actinotalea sp. BY-33]|uniref:DUF559 domain-containing protein n=1 Tax=Actinotalea soli TaxID=2819234 RepID=A0A939LVU4_9CELL|nr:hypothetical protein [Actinotalea soli]MBO1753079.1 hypothetical protein [Actinotalea soli]